MEKFNKFNETKKLMNKSIQELKTIKEKSNNFPQAEFEECINKLEKLYESYKKKLEILTQLDDDDQGIIQSIKKRLGEIESDFCHAKDPLDAILFESMATKFSEFTELGSKWGEKLINGASYEELEKSRKEVCDIYKQSEDIFGSMMGKEFVEELKSMSGSFVENYPEEKLKELVDLYNSGQTDSEQFKQLVGEFNQGENTCYEYEKQFEEQIRQKVEDQATKMKLI